MRVQTQSWPRGAGPVWNKANNSFKTAVFAKYERLPFGVVWTDILTSAALFSQRNHPITQYADIIVAMFVPKYNNFLMTAGSVLLQYLPLIM